MPVRGRRWEGKLERNVSLPVQILVYAAILFALLLISAEDRAGRQAVFGAGILLALVLHRAAEGRPVSETGLRFTGFARWAVLGGLWGGAAATAAAVILKMCGWLRWTAPVSPEEVFLGMAGLLLPVLWQEIFFRGYLYAALDRRYGVRTAVVGSAAAFGLFGLLAGPVHPVAGCNAFLRGLLLAGLRERTGSLGWEVGFEWMWRSFQDALFGFPSVRTPGRVVLEGPAAVTGGRSGAEAGWLFTVLLFILLVLTRKSSERSE